MSITYFKSVFVALDIQQAMRMHHVILLSVACPVLQYFRHYSINSTILDKGY
jgi:hypothetical protein